MDIEKNYTVLLRTAVAIICDDKFILPGDLISETYIRNFERIPTMSLREFKDHMFMYFKEERNYLSKTRVSAEWVLDSGWKEKVVPRSNHLCGYFFIDEYNKNYYRRKKAEQWFKDLRNKHTKKYYERVGCIRQKEYLQREKEKLSDYYIKTLIRSARKRRKDNSPITQEMIEVKRSQVLSRLRKVA